MRNWKYGSLLTSKLHPKLETAIYFDNHDTQLCLLQS